MMQQEDEEQTGAAEPAVPEPKDTTNLEQALAEEKEKASGYLANWQRTEADLANYKRRSEQEKQEIAQFANTSLILNILPALDDMERAFASLPSRTTHQEWVKGIKLVGRKLLNSLDAMGLTHIEAVGEPFDPNLHEAVRQDKGAEGIVIEEVQQGYKLHDRVIRPTKVVVGNGEETED